MVTFPSWTRPTSCPKNEGSCRKRIKLQHVRDVSPRLATAEQRNDRTNYFRKFATGEVPRQAASPRVLETRGDKFEKHPREPWKPSSARRNFSPRPDYLISCTHNYPLNLKHEIRRSFADVRPWKKNKKELSRVVACVRFEAPPRDEITPREFLSAFTEISNRNPPSTCFRGDFNSWHVTRARSFDCLLTTRKNRNVGEGKWLRSARELGEDQTESEGNQQTAKLFSFEVCNASAILCRWSTRSLLVISILAEFYASANTYTIVRTPVTRPNLLEHAPMPPTGTHNCLITSRSLYHACPWQSPGTLYHQ